MKNIVYEIDQFIIISKNGIKNHKPPLIFRIILKICIFLMCISSDRIFFPTNPVQINQPQPINKLDV